MGLNETNGGLSIIFFIAYASTIIIANINIPANTDSSKSPRGVRGFALDGNTPFTQWKVQGKIGGYKKCAVPHLLNF